MENTNTTKQTIITFKYTLKGGLEVLRVLFIDIKTP